MNKLNPLQAWKHLLKPVRENLHLVIGPTVALVLLGGGYCLMSGRSWKATQAIVVRDEAVGGLARRGRFDNVEQMKSALETLQEVVRSQAVVGAALAEIGPSGGGEWGPDGPSPRHIRGAQSAVALKAPKGAEFGKTEVVHLVVSAPSNERAIAFSQAVARALESRLQELRKSRAESMISELETAVELAEADLAASTRQMETMESQVGSDLGELRTMNEVGAGESNLRSATTQIKNELRQTRASRDAHQQLLEQLLTAKDNPEGITAFPSRLLEAQPALRRLKDGLVDAQLRRAEALGRMSPAHPVAAAAIAAEKEVYRDLQAEIGNACQGLKAEIEIGEALMKSLEKQLADVNQRLDKLAGLRARYQNHAEEIRQRSQIVEKARKELADAQSIVAGASSAASLITLIDAPAVNDRPSGPGALTVLGGAGVAGLMSGLGLIVLLHGAGPVQEQSWAGYVAWGRRAGDYLRRGRRASDASGAPSPPVPGGRRNEDRAATPPAGQRRAADRAPSPPQRRAEDQAASGPAQRRAEDGQSTVASTPAASAAAAETPPEPTEPPLKTKGPQLQTMGALGPKPAAPLSAAAPPWAKTATNRRSSPPITGRPTRAYGPMPTSEPPAPPASDSPQKPIA